jgi:hypothetical protein
MLNMSELIGPHHPDDEAVEQYCMGRLSGTELEHFKLHVLLCLVCHYRIDEVQKRVHFTWRPIVFPRLCGSRSLE